MPIKHENFDLKSHIESAGHQLDLHKQITISSEFCQGYLQKLTVGKIRNSWHRRWFKFDRQNKQLYYGDKNMKDGTQIPFQVRIF